MKLPLTHISKFSCAYWIIEKTWLRLLFYFWFKKIYIHNAQQVTKNQSIIIAPNHQNAAIDAISIIYSQQNQVVWLARADIFASKLLKKILFFLKILPIYRLHDGRKELDKNNKIFNACFAVLEAKQTLALFPEATHWGFRRLRKTKKAIPRIAFDALSKPNGIKELQIIPAGIYYDNYNNLRSNIHIEYGKAIAVEQLLPLYQTDKNAAIQELKSQIEEGIKACIIHIPFENETYHAIEILRYVCQDVVLPNIPNTHNVTHRTFLAHQTITNTLTEAAKTNHKEFTEICNKAIELGKLLDKKNIQIQHIQPINEFSLIWLSMKCLMFLPVVAVGLIVYGIPHFAITKISKKVTDDTEFRNTLVFGFYYIMLPILYTILGIALCVFSSLQWHYILVIIALLFACGVITANTLLHMQLIYSNLQLKYNKLIIKENSIQSRIESMRIAFRKLQKHE